MKKYRRTIAMLMILTLLNGCASHVQPIETEPPATAATVPAERPPAEESGLPPTEETIPARESVEETEEASVTESAAPKVTEPKEPERKPERNDTPATEASEETEPPATTPPETEPPTTEPPAKEQDETIPPETVPEETGPPAEEPDQTEAPTTEVSKESEAGAMVELEVEQICSRDVEVALLKYINQYRYSPLTRLRGMSEVARYRSRKIVYDFNHSTVLMREALAYFQYGRYVDATQYGDPAENSYYEYDGREAIAYRGQGKSVITADEMGRLLADQIKNSTSHWIYVGSSEYSYVGIGATESVGIWYVSVMVGRVNYG